MAGNSVSVGFETATTCMEPMWLVTIQAPVEEVDTIMDALAAVDPLTIGPYDRCAFQSGAGIERYRPREGAAAGKEEAIRKRPDVVEVSFQLPRDRSRLGRVVEAIVATHSYQEPVFMVQEVLASRSKGGDLDNPNRWWNKGGDWKARS